MPPPTRFRPPTQFFWSASPGTALRHKQKVSSYASTPLPPAPGSQAYGLPHDPRPGNLGGGKIPARSNSPLSASGGGPRAHLRSPDANAAHGRNASMSSLNGSSSALSPASATSGKHPRRPSTSGQPLVLPSTLPVPINPYPINLSPIAEGFVPPQSMHAGSPATPAAYTVGRGPFMRPITPSHSNGPSLEDLRRGLVKFQLPEEGRSFTINVADCAGGIEVLEKALKKFNKLAGRNPDVMDYVQTAEGGLIVDGWGVYLDWGHENGSATPLTEADLLAICHAAPDEPAREHGLTLRRINKPKKSALQQLFGGGAHDSPTSPRLPGYRGDDDDGRPLGTGQTTSVAMKRASSISVLSGLGVPDPEKILDPPTSPTLNTPQPKATPQRQSFIKPSKLRNFFGQRPPSELITTHLPDYFPGAQRKVLERTWRNSSLHGKPSGFGGRRDSAASWATAAPNHSRFSVSTMGSHMSPNRGSMDAPPPIPTRPSFTLSLNDESEPPRVSLSTEDGRSFELDPDERPQLLPPVNLPSESLVATMESLTRNEHRPPSSLSSKRMSYITELRSKRDVSDTASLMTVDQITAEVENRRASQMLHLDGSSSDEWTKVGSDDEDTLENEKEVEEVEEVPAEEPADVEEEEEEDEDEDEDEEEEAGATKWIRGALIGAGSFGQVYLGMDASNGLLMAVKQVELPKGTTPNEERKKNMLTALEREIELLKVLQHPNIVQYLYSSMDEDHLNIFLEYVPGGSITALLSNYGAFEEPLVRNFLRQILQGLAYLHDQDIIHRDIKGANILVDNKGNIKISDFGISKKVGGALIAGSRANRPSLQGSVFWMAPEVVKQTAHSPKADIWSVGCLVVEMFTGEHPWAQLTQMQAIFKIGSSARPTVPADISAEAKEFLELTFDLDYEKRPSALESLQHPWLAIKPAKSSSKNAAAKALPAVEVAA